MAKYSPLREKAEFPSIPREAGCPLGQVRRAREPRGIRKAEDHNITVEYINSSFLVKKPNGGHRLVTVFADVGRYSKPEPTLMPDADSTLRQIGQWQYICVSDLSSAFYQIPLDKACMKYCGVVTSFRGVRAYARCAVGMPGSEGALEELMCRVLGNLLKERVIAKSADDLYCGGNTPTEVLRTWKSVLSSFSSTTSVYQPQRPVLPPKDHNLRMGIGGWRNISKPTHRVFVINQRSTHHCQGYAFIYRRI